MGCTTESDMRFERSVHDMHPLALLPDDCLFLLPFLFLSSMPSGCYS